MAPASHPIFPDWPVCLDDLVPLPMIDGPKLKPFDFGGPQQIEFVKYIASGLHGHVVQARIHGQDYAIKLFRYSCTEAWYSTLSCYNPEREHKDEVAVLAPYSEPFYAECRAFGRLHETGRTDLAIDCFGYVLLDEAHERALHDLKQLEFNGNDDWNAGDVRSDFRGPSGRPPPIRGIVKALGRPDNMIEKLSYATARPLLDNIIQVQQLGIIRLDVQRGQYIDWKFGDFSTAMTTPHFLITPELLQDPIKTTKPLYPASLVQPVRPLPPVALAAVEYQLFIYCIADYWDFESMISACWDWDNYAFKPLDLFILSGRNRYKLRRTARHRTIPYTLVDPRRFDWRAPQAAAAAAGLAKPLTTSAARALAVRLPRWYYPCDMDVERYLRTEYEWVWVMQWAVRDGCIFPTKYEQGEVCHKLTLLLKSNGGELDMKKPEHVALVEADKDARFLMDETFSPPIMKTLILRAYE